MYVNKHDTRNIQFFFFHMGRRDNILNIHIEWEKTNCSEKARNISPGDSTFVQLNRYHYKIVEGSCVENETVNMYNV